MDNISGVYLLDFGGQRGQHAGNPFFVQDANWEK